MSKRKTHEQFLKDMKEKGNPNVIVLGTYKKSTEKIKCQCKNNPEHIWYATPSNLLRGRGCPYCKSEKIGKMFSITEEEFLKRFAEKGRADELEIVEHYKKSSEAILVRCRKNKQHEFYARPSFLLSGMHCLYCTGHRVDMTNCLNTLRPDLTIFLKNKEDGNKVTLKSEIILDLKCPNCGFEKTKSVKELNRLGFSCPICGDNISFPNKFIRNMLQMLKINFISEWSCEWTQGKRYDIYFELNNEKILVEMDGAFHKKESQYKTLENNKKIDKLKNELAKENGYKLIRIDCENTNPKNIFENIKKSELNNILNLNNFDWKECAIKSSNSILVEICKYYNKHSNISMRKLGKKFNVSQSTALNYLRKGKEIGICTVNVKEKIKRNKIIKVIDKNTNKAVIYNSKKELLENLESDFGQKISESTLSRIIKKEVQSKKWEDFEFIELKK